MRMPEKWERRRSQEDRVWDDDYDRWLYHWTYGDWSLFDDPPWETAYFLPDGMKIEYCLICNGTGLEVLDKYHSRDAWTPFKIPATCGYNFIRSCSNCGGTGITSILK